MRITMRFLLACVLLSVLLAGCATRAGQAVGERREALSFSAAGLRAMRASGLEGPDLAGGRALVRHADRDLAMAPETVTAKTALPPGAEPRDYVSLAVYYWPDPANPGGAYVSRDGLINPEREDGRRYDALRLDKTTDAVVRLGLAWALTGREEYARKAEELVRVFFFDPVTGMKPSLDFAQGSPGAKAGWGHPRGIIETHRLVEMLDALTLMEASPEWPQASKTAMRGWCAAYLDWLLVSPNGRTEGRAANNHGVWYDAQVVALALYAGRPEVARRTVEAAQAGRIAVQIEPDGRMPREEARTRSLHYVLFTLRPFMALSRAGQEMDVDLAGYETADGRSLLAVYRRVVAHLVDSAPWPGKNIVQNEKESAAAAPLAWAETRYGPALGPGRARAAADKLLGDSAGSRRVMAESFAWAQRAGGGLK